MRLIAVALVFAASSAAAQVGVTVDINRPGVYGRISIGGYPPPLLVYPEPVIIVQPSYPAQYAQPIYLYVPPGHAQKWSKHCHRYGACNQPVYFVQERWVREQYNERHRGDGRGHGKGHGKGRD